MSLGTLGSNWLTTLTSTESEGEIHQAGEPGDKRTGLYNEQRQRFLICQAPGTLHVALSLGTTEEEPKELLRAERVCKGQDPALLGPGETLELGLPNATSLLKPDYIKNAQSLFPTKLMEPGLLCIASECISLIPTPPGCL